MKISSNHLYPLLSLPFIICCDRADRGQIDGSPKVLYQEFRFCFEIREMQASVSVGGPEAPAEKLPVPGSQVKTRRIRRLQEAEALDRHGRFKRSGRCDADVVVERL